MFKNIFNYLNGSRPKKLERERTDSEKSESKRLSYPTIVIEESFTLEGPKGDAIFKILLEVPVPMDDYSNKEEVENMKKSAYATFGPVITTLRHYLEGICRENSPERFMIGRENLIIAIKQCAAAQIKVTQEAEKNR